PHGPVARGAARHPAFARKLPLHRNGRAPPPVHGRLSGPVRRISLAARISPAGAVGRGPWLREQGQSGGVETSKRLDRSRLPDGRMVAVKVRYPEIDQAMAADFRRAAVGARIAAIVYPGASVEPMIRELRTRFLEECDYPHEARMQTRFDRALVANLAARGADRRSFRNGSDVRGVVRPLTNQQAHLSCARQTAELSRGRTSEPSGWSRIGSSPPAARWRAPGRSRSVLDRRGNRYRHGRPGRRRIRCSRTPSLRVPRAARPARRGR